MKARSLSSAAFTLLELLLVVVIVSLLVALSSPLLARTMNSAKRSVSLANIRLHVATIAAYSGDFADQFPYLTDPRATYSVLRCREQARRVEYFELQFQWHFGLADAYYDGDCNSPSFWPPRTRPTYATSYYYSPTCISGAEFWNPRTRVGPQQWHSVHQSEVVFPSSKGVLWNRAAMPGLTLEYPIGMPEIGLADGSAQLHAMSGFNRPYRDGEGAFPGTYFGGFGLPVLHTIDGVRGRDVR